MFTLFVKILMIEIRMMTTTLVVSMVVMIFMEVSITNVVVAAIEGSRRTSFFVQSSKQPLV